MRELRHFTFGPTEIPVAVRPPVVEPDRGMLDTVASAVREIYMMCYRDAMRKPDYGRTPIAQWDGGEDRHGKVWSTPVWPGIAATIINLQADPLAYIKAQFSLAQSSRPPRPNQLCSHTAVEMWEYYRSQAADQVARQLVANEKAVLAAADPMVAALAWEADRALRYVLNSTAIVSATPLYRYCLGTMKGFPEVATRFREAAMLQYVFQKSAYDASWGGFIPQELQQAAMELRNHLAGGSHRHD